MLHNTRLLHTLEHTFGTANNYWHWSSCYYWPTCCLLLRRFLRRVYDALQLDSLCWLAVTLAIDGSLCSMGNNDWKWAWHTLDWGWAWAFINWSHTGKLVVVSCSTSPVPWSEGKTLVLPLLLSLLRSLLMDIRRLGDFSGWEEYAWSSTDEHLDKLRERHLGVLKLPGRLGISAVICGRDLVEDEPPWPMPGELSWELTWLWFPQKRMLLG